MSMIRSISLVTAVALGIAPACGGDPVVEQGSSLRDNPARFAAAAAPRTTSSAMVGTPPVTALVLYDTTGAWGFLGEQYAIGAGNLASHFGGWTAKPASQYTCGELIRYTAAIYLGSTADEPLPTCLLDDILAGARPVLWSFYNIWQLSGRSATFATTYGWSPGDLDFSWVGEVDYKDHALERYAGNGDGILAPIISDAAKVQVLALARRGDGTTLPWAIRSGNLTYVGETPFRHVTEEDRYLVYADLLFDALAPATPERHRALLRLEDINPTNDAAQLQAIAEYLDGEHIPYGFGLDSDGVPGHARLDQTPDLVATLNYTASHGGVMVTRAATLSAGQLFPYPVRDGAGAPVVPADLGTISVDAWQGVPPRLPIDIINAGDKNLVVRDGVAGFTFDPFLDVQYLKDTIDGLRALGYTFVSPTRL